MKPLIKWPGGKAGEIEIIEQYIPSFDRYIEPFFGGGAIFFHLMPSDAVINDISSSLTDYYKLLKKQDKLLQAFLLSYNNSFNNLLNICLNNYSKILNLYCLLEANELCISDLKIKLSDFVTEISPEIVFDCSEKIILDLERFNSYIVKMSADKMQRTITNNQKKPFSDEDLCANLLTGFLSGYYMYFREVYNDINLKRIKVSIQYKTANFYFIREYCYGSMFRYNAKGEFNIPYGGISYNTKNFKSKIDYMFNKEIEKVLKNTDIACADFEEFLRKVNPSEKDFIFLDPPYDTDFSDYEGKAFTKSDQERLACVLKNTKAKFILVIKNTEFIYNLYKDNFNIVAFDNRYTYNVRSRNDRSTEHLLITNLPIKE